MAATASDVAAQAWDDAAQGWSRQGDLIRVWLHEATAAMLDAAQIGPGDRVLDVAAGAGDQTLDVARRVGPSGLVVASDVSPRILALAADNLQRAGLKQVRTLQADAQSLQLDGAEFDAAVCRLGLMFCTQPLLALQQIHHALVPGGRFSALVFGAPAANPCITIAMRTALRHAGLAPGDPGAPGSLLSLGRPGLLTGLLQRSGFGEVSVRALSAPFRLARCADYVAFVRSAGAPVIETLKRLDERARDAAWADIAAQLDRFSTPDGWVGPNELLLCSAVKP
jgi:ubiquinone/menaquinone biosynthesis C-methylase UbiE